MTGEGDRVGRRRVFYIPGYDPFHPRRYRELYRREGAAQARISGYRLRLSPGRRQERYGWHVAFEGDGGAAEAEVEVLVWSDIVAASMGQSIAATYWQLVRTVRVYVASGAIFRLLRLRKGPAIAALYPIGVLTGQAGLAVAAGVAALALVRRGAAALWPLAPAAAPAILGLGLGAGAGIALLRWFRRHDNRIFAWYLMHDFAFTASVGGAVPDALRPRLRAFADRIAEALGEDWDEVLVVGHSSGAHLAVTVLAELIRRGGVPADGPGLGFLSLGQVVPMVSFLPGAEDLRRDLAFLSARPDLTWVDVSAPGDGCAYALCDPVAVSGMATAAKRWPLVVSAAFTQTLSPETRRSLRWRFFRLHFQYLCAFDRPGDYDYFRITAGPMSLAARYRGRAPSQSRIERAVNRSGMAG
ncbi:hypothetical protein [Albidovulum sp.]|jgi:hypothetical protein|uniref:hypothetical protein n=1 Tax=Albidovulum sp. TaxID=1872424 RepID=UPI00305CBE34